MNTFTCALPHLHRRRPPARSPSCARCWTSPRRGGRTRGRRGGQWAAPRRGRTTPRGCPPPPCSSETPTPWLCLCWATVPYGRVYLNAGLCFGQVVRGLVVSRKPIRPVLRHATPRFDSRVQPAPYVHTDVRFFLVPSWCNKRRPAGAGEGCRIAICCFNDPGSPALVVNDPGSSFEEYLLAEASPLDYPEKV